MTSPQLSGQLQEMRKPDCPSGTTRDAGRRSTRRGGLVLLLLVQAVIAACTDGDAPGPAVIDLLQLLPASTFDTDALLAQNAVVLAEVSFGAGPVRDDARLGPDLEAGLLGLPRSDGEAGSIEPHGDHLVLGGPLAFGHALDVTGDGVLLCRVRCRGADAEGALWVVQLGERPDDLRDSQQLAATALKAPQPLRPRGVAGTDGWQDFGAVVRLRSEARALLFVIIVRQTVVHLDRLELLAIPPQLVPLAQAGDRRLVSIERDQRETLLLPTPGEVVVPLRLPGRFPRFTGAVAMLGAGSSPVDVQVSATSGDVQLRTDRRLEGPTDGTRWAPLVLDLTPLAGQDVELRLSVRGAAGGLVAFGNPLIEADVDERRPPDVILISLDTMRADRMSLYGYERPTTPRLDALAVTACVFEQAVAPAPWTLPSHATLFTGQLPDRHGVVTRGGRLDAERVELLATAFRRAGYQTVAFTGGGFLDPEFGFGADFERYGTEDPSSPPPGWLASSPAASPQRGEPRPDDDALGELVALLRSDRRRPLFLFLQSYAAHDYRSLPADLIAVGAGADDVQALRGGVNTLRWNQLAEQGRADRTMVRRARLAYDGALRVADRLVGTVVDELVAAGTLDRTLLVVTSDHGEELFERGRLGHATDVYEEQVHVPLLMRGPGIVAGRVSALVSLADVPVTLRALAGLPPSASIQDGRSLRPLLQGGSLPPGSTVILSGKGVRALRLDGAKLVVRHGGRGVTRQLFDLSADPGERNDVAKRAGRDVERLQRQLDRLLAELHSEATTLPDQELSDELLDDLRRLGYVDG